MSSTIDVFSIHKNVIADYKHFVDSYINIKNDAIRNVVESEVADGKFWPEPLIHFNPSFEIAGKIEDVCGTGLLHKNLANIFKGYDLYRHQVAALTLGTQQRDFVVTSGTGSGKSLTYIGTIFDYLLKNRHSTGIKAIIVYPMNALINSQTQELNKYKERYEKSTSGVFPIRFGQYTGQENEDDRNRLRAELPDILLTNYMMLELILTRSNQQERELRHSIYENLEFLVFDELHTYRGRQGSDVSMLIRRIKAQAENPITCIGTSATMVSGGSSDEQKSEVGKIASIIFGSNFSNEQIITETLKRCFPYDGSLPGQGELSKALTQPIDLNGNEEMLKQHPLSIWLENKVALKAVDGNLGRNRPMPFREIVDLLSNDSGMTKDACENQLVQYLKWLTAVNQKIALPHYSYLPYKIHQFISQTGSVYVSLNLDEKRIITLDPINHKGSGDDKIPIFPVVFSRVSGHEFICVSKSYKNHTLKPREFRDFEDEEEESVTAGYIITGENIWDESADLENLPNAWVKIDNSGKVKPEKKYADRLPQRIYFNGKGEFSDSDASLPFSGWFMPAKLLFDPTSGTVYDTKTSEGTKLTRLGSEGRSSSTTVLTYSILTQLENSGFERKDQKLLSFTDNRQDAALQSGHFNDYIQIAQLRSAIYRALQTNGLLDFTTLDQAIFDAIGLTQEAYANNVAEFPSAIRDNENAFKKYLMYLALYDLRRGWRVVLPNLEQCALLQIDYMNIDENVALESPWKVIPFLSTVTVAERREIVYQILDYFRKAYAIHSDEYLSNESINRNRKTITEKLKAPWKFEDKERINEPCFMRYETLHQRNRRFTASIGSNSMLGKYLRKEAQKRGEALKGDSYIAFIKQLMGLLVSAGWLHETIARNANNEDTTMYQLRIDQIIWKLGDEKTILPDEIKRSSYKDVSEKPNLYFQSIYKTDFRKLKSLIAREHTGQLSTDDRKEREAKFGEGEYSALFCSPTMELGIDIKNLSVVHMRNVPPSPANYAQRGGRAGRSGQAALVFTSCSQYSPHDRHYFKNADKMVAGVVTPPRIDLANKELLISHLQALYLAKAGIGELNSSIYDLLDNTVPETLPLKTEIKERLQLGATAKQEIKSQFDKIIHEYSNGCFSNASWLNDEWVDTVLNAAGKNFDRALDRWRRMFLSAKHQLEEAYAVISGGRYTQGSQEMKDAMRNQYQAIRQQTLLKNQQNKSNLSEFYPYRYLASEGYLPGYNFTRLPIRTFVPKGEYGEYISRSRFIALREFGPGNIIYHSGNRYKIEQLLISEEDKNLRKAKVSKNSGYILMDGDYHYETCPFSNVSLASGSSVDYYTDMVQMTETKTSEMDRISCEEEERLSKGYDIHTYFSIPGGMETVQVAKIKNAEDDFLKISYIPAARLVQINNRWRTAKEDGFLMGMRTGYWKRLTQLEKKDESSEDMRMVKLYTHDTADALYIEPIKALNLNKDGIVTLLFAFKRAIEEYFQIESREIGVELLGDESYPNLFIYEAAEGSLGILSQFMADAGVFNAIVKKAYDICRFADTSYTDEASYDDLLSYYNQRYHDQINRYLIEDALEKLKVCHTEIITHDNTLDYDAHYQELLRHIDPNSSTETRFLKYLYDSGLRLPDEAQKSVDGIFVRPDFFYKPDIFVFCDGTPHDQPETQERDREQRRAMRDRGLQVIVYYYRDDLAQLVAKRPDIFKKVR